MIPEQFVKGNDLFQQRSQEIVKETASKIKEGGDLTQLFHTLLKELADKRCQIEVANQNPKDWQFGLRRDQMLSGLCYRTPLHRKDYRPTNQVLLGLIASKFSGQQINPGFNKYKDKFLSVKLLEKRSTQESIDKLETTYLEDKKKQRKFSKEFYPEWIKDKSFKLHNTDYLLCLNELIKDHCDPEKFSYLSKALKGDPISGADYYDLLTEFNEEDQVRIADFFKHDKIKIAQYFAKILAKDARNAFVVAKVYLEFGGEKLVATQYLTWLHSNYGEDPLERMKRCSTVWISHLSYTLIPKALDDIASIFCKAVLCDDLKTLIPIMGEFRFKFAFACPFERGSAAIAEWFEKAIYLSKNYELSYKNVMIDLKAFETPSLPLFLEKYPEFIELKKL